MNKLMDETLHKGLGTKESIRNEIKNKRQGLEKKEIIEKSRKIKEKLFSTREFQSAGTIAFYTSIKQGNEVETKEMIKESLKLGKKVLVPIINISRKQMKFSEIKKFNELVTGTFGILEPKSSISINPYEIRLIIVPGIAFDLHGNRIGHGLGFYDKFLSKLSEDVTKIGLAFELQIVENLPNKYHDVRVNKIITENNIINCK